MHNPDALIIGVTSRALFNLEEEHKIFVEKGFKAYRDYQVSHVDEHLEQGVAFPFISRLLNLNKHFGREVVKVAVISKNSPETGQRVFNSCRHYKLPIQMGAFTSGQSTIEMLDALDIGLFLSANRETVDEAIALGKPAGLVLQPEHQQSVEEPIETPLRIAFDFDGVIADDESERQYQSAGLDGFNRYETEKAQTPHSPGPLAKLFQQLSDLQKLELELFADQKSNKYRPAFRIAIITSRGATSGLRLMTTLRENYGMTAVELYLLDGISKKPLLEKIRPHIFFDDQYNHLKETSSSVPSVLIPFGIHKKQIDA